MKETCYRVKMTGCRVKIKGFGRVEKKRFQRVGKKRNLEGERKKVSRVGKKGRVKKTFFEGEKKREPLCKSIWITGKKVSKKTSPHGQLPSHMQGRVRTS